MLQWQHKKPESGTIAPGLALDATPALPLLLGIAFVSMLNGTGTERSATFALEQAVIPGLGPDSRRTWNLAFYNVLIDAGLSLGALGAGLPLLIQNQFNVSLLGSYRVPFLGYSGLWVYGQGGDVFKPGKVAITPEFQQELLSILDKAQRAAEERLKIGSSDKEAMYWAGVSHGTRATYHFVLRKEYMPALHEATEAYKYHSCLLKLDPQYFDAYLIVGMNNYVVGSLPWYIKVLATLTGRHGNRAEGLQQVARAKEQGHYARDDAELMLAVLYQREKRYAEALVLYQEMARSYFRNYLLLDEVGVIFGLLNEWRSATSTFDSILSRYRTGEPGYKDIPLAKVLYQSAQAHERLQENEQALARYTEAGRLPGYDHYSYISELAAAELQMCLQHPTEARQHYQRVVDAVPQSEEGKLARRAVAKLPPD